MSVNQNQAEGTAISPDLLAILVCPVDKQAVRLEESGLVCSVCGRVYPIKDGIPYMLADEDV